MAPSYKFTNFDLSGIVECIRWLFKYGGVEFEDVRIPYEKWPEFKDKTPFGQLPILEENGKVVNQSIAISRYLAKKFKLNGKDDWEDLEIDALVDTLNDLRIKLNKYILAEESKKEEELQKIINEVVPFYFERFSKNVKNGYLVGGRLTWADFYFVALISLYGNFLKIDLFFKYSSLNTVKNNVFNTPAIKEWLAVRPADIYT